MQPDNIAEQNELFTKLSNLENKVANMTKELAIDKDTIQKLQNLLTEKQDSILKLETALSDAQQTLKGQGLNSIAQLKQQLINGVEEKAITPALQQLHQRIDKIQQLIAETKQFINTQVTEINNTINNTTSLLSGLPQQAKEYFTKAYATVIETQINTLIETLHAYIEKSKQMTEQKIISPVKTSVASVITYSKEKSASLQFHVEDKLITSPRESMSEFFDDLLFICKEFLKEIFYQLKKIMLLQYEKIMACIEQTSAYQASKNTITSIRHPKSDSNEAYA